MSQRHLAAFALAALLAVPASGQAGLGASALRNHDNRAPIDIDAARIEVRDQDRQAIFSGSVKVRQGAMALDSARIRVFYDRLGSDLEIKRLDADGGVELTSPSERASARYGVYDVPARTLTMVGGVVLHQGESVLRGERLMINLETGRSTLDGRASADSAAPASRVTGRFVVSPRKSAQ